ncbi:MAG: PAS domain-containing protein, partial [Cyanophyceae cyanobacterium]
MKPQEAQEKSDRPGAEILLKQSQERCWLAVQGSREGLWDWDILTHQVYFAPRFKEILGYATAEMPNELKAWEAKLHPDDRARVLAALHNHLESRIPFDIEYRLRKKTGDYCWVHARGQGIWNEAGRATRIAGSISDITERKHSEVAFHEHHRLLQAINSVQTQFVTDAEPQVVFNNMLTHLLELTRSEYGFIGEILFAADGAPYIEKSYLKMRGRPFLKTHAISNLAWNEETRAFYAENAPKGMEFHNLETLFGAAIVTGKPVVANSPNTDSRRGGLPDGHPPLKAFLGVPFYSNNQMTGMVGIANREEGYDTTIIDYLQPFLTTCSRIVEAYRISCHKQQAEEKVREQAALLNVATDAIMVWGFNHRILYWNRGAERLYGWSSEEALGQDANELLYAEPLSNLPEMQRELEATGEWQGELNQMTKADQPIIVNSRWTLVRQEGKLPSILVVNTDITEKKQLEAQFLRTQRLESLGTLAGGIAHDFNNILTPILGFAQLLPKKLSLDPQAQDIFKIIETNAVRGKDLIQQILTFARGLEGRRGAVQLCHLITEIKKIATQTFPKNIEIQTSVSKELPTVEGDATQLHQVLMNLAVNARDAMPQGGILRLSAKPFTVDTHYARLHLEAQEGSYTLIEVKDTGVGIPAER